MHYNIPLCNDIYIKDKEKNIFFDKSLLKRYENTFFFLKYSFTIFLSFQ